jgi:hypothetical protein
MFPTRLILEQKSQEAYPRPKHIKGDGAVGLCSNYGEVVFLPVGNGCIPKLRALG